MAGTLIINFTELPDPGRLLTVVARYQNNQGTFSTKNFRIEFRNTRTQNRQCTIGSDVEELALNYVYAMNADWSDYGGTDNLQAQLAPAGVYAPGTVELTLQSNTWQFDDIISVADFFTYDIENEPVEDPKSVAFSEYDYQASTCDTSVVLIDVTGGNGLYNAYIEGQQVVSGAASPIEVSVPRNTPRYVGISDTTGENIGVLFIRSPKKIVGDNINPTINYTASGASVLVQVDFISQYLFPLEYSLNGNDYQENSSFTGQADGEYTVYVRDAFGCVTTKDFVVDGSSEVTKVNFEVSDINPIRYALVNSGKKNRYNTLSHEQLKNLPYSYTQKFLETDSPVTQIKTNAFYLDIFALGCDGTKYELNPVKRSNHIGQQLKTTATKFSADGDRTGLYFGSVDVLDILSDEVISTKDYGYQIPYAFDKEGRVVSIEGIGTVLVNEIVYNNDYEAFVLVFDITYTGAETEVTIEATYNVQNYEIYEFITDMSALPEQFNVVIQGGVNADNLSHTYISERITRVPDSDRLYEIIYWNTTNLGGMNYGTGVVHTLRMDEVVSRLSDEQTVEGFNGDVERYNTKQELFDGEEFNFMYLSEEYVRKMRLVLAHDRLFINGILYRLGDTPEAEPSFTTNLASLTAILRKGGDTTESFDREIIQPVSGEGVDQATYELEQAIATAKGKALILWKK